MAAAVICTFSTASTRLPRWETYQTPPTVWPINIPTTVTISATGIPRVTCHLLSSGYESPVSATFFFLTAIAFQRQSIPIVSDLRGRRGAGIASSGSSVCRIIGINLRLHGRPRRINLCVQRGKRGKLVGGRHARILQLSNDVLHRRIDGADLVDDVGQQLGQRIDDAFDHRDRGRRRADQWQYLLDNRQNGEDGAGNHVTTPSRC